VSVCTRPQDMPDLRNRLHEFVAQYGQDVIRNKLDGSDDPFYEYIKSQKLRGTNPLDGVARAFGDATAEFLKISELFYVRSEMAQLAVVAGKSLPGFNITQEDLPSREGFIFFETPIHTRASEIREVTLDGSRQRDEARAVEVDIVAVSWYEIQQSVHLIWWESLRAEQFAMDPRIPLNWGLEMHLPFDKGSDTFFDPDLGKSLPVQEVDTTEHTIGWVTTLKSVWLLMKQELSSTEEVHFDRAAHRRAKKEKRPAPRVRVIALRRTGQGSGESGSREWHHRWIVRGHWRQQWYASRGVHRPVWIAPHLKGPEDAPLIGGEKVYDLRR
jgi:hypothetical protein